jgi:outer membrane immunogenic protein
LTNSVGASPVPYSADPKGVIGGGFLGYNYQINQFVVGIEADWQAANLTGSASSALFGGYTISTKVNDYGSLRGRLGYAMDRWLVFATGGWAWGKASTSYANTGAAPFFTNTFTGNGWTAGGGVEYAITNNWLARIEYRYTDLGSHSYIDVPSNSGETGNRVTINDVRLGVAYKF